MGYTDKSSLKSHTQSRIVAAGGVSIKTCFKKVGSAAAQSGISCGGVAIATTDSLQAISAMKTLTATESVKTVANFTGATITAAGTVTLAAVPAGFTNGLLMVIWTNNPSS